MTPKFSAQEAIQYSWLKAKENLNAFLGLSGIWFLIQIIPTLVKQMFENKNEMSGLLLLANIVSIILGIIFNYNILKISIRIVDGKTFEISDIFGVEFNELLDYVGARIVTVLIFVGGFLLLIVPGFIWCFKYFFTAYLVVDRKMPVMSALKESGVLTEGQKWELFRLSVIILGINFLGLLCLFVGLFVTIPMSWVAVAYAYRKLVPSPILTA